MSPGLLVLPQEPVGGFSATNSEPNLFARPFTTAFLLRIRLFGSHNVRRVGIHSAQELPHKFNLVGLLHVCILPLNKICAGGSDLAKSCMTLLLVCAGCLYVFLACAGGHWVTIGRARESPTPAIAQFVLFSFHGVQLRASSCSLYTTTTLVCVKKNQLYAVCSQPAVQ